MMWSDPYGERRFSWWVVGGIAGIGLIAGTVCLIHWMLTPAGWLSLLGAVGMLGACGLVKAKQAKAAGGVVLLVGLLFIAGFPAALMNRETGQVQQRVAPIAQQMIKADQKLMVPATASPTLLPADPRTPAPIYLLSPKVIKEGYQVPGAVR